MRRLIYLAVFLNGQISGEELPEPIKFQQAAQFPKVAPKITIQPKEKILIPSRLGYGYRYNSSPVRFGFSGRAFYKLVLSKDSDVETSFTAGAKIDHTSMKIKELKFDDQTQAFMHLGINRQIDPDSVNPKSIHLELAPPLYDNQRRFGTSLELSYRARF